MGSPRSQDNWPLLVLTGAGASVPLNLPTTVGFVDELLATEPCHAVALSRAIDSCKRRHSVDVVDIEAVLDHLAEFAHGARSVVCEAVHAARLDFEWVDSLLEEYSALRRAALEHIVSTYGMVDADTAAETLHPLLWGLASALDVSLLPVFTLNYDMAIETYIDERRGDIDLIDGFDRSPTAMVRRWKRELLEDSLQQQRVHGDKLRVLLIKLHGSTSWAKHRDTREIHQIGFLPKDPGAYETLIHYPSIDAKPTFEEPYRTGFDTLWKVIPHTERILVIGTSFRDASIRDALLRLPRSARLIVNGMPPEPSFVATIRERGIESEFVPGNIGEPRVRRAVIGAVLRPRDTWRNRRNHGLIANLVSAGLYRSGDNETGVVLDGDIVAKGRDWYFVQDGLLRHIPDIPTYNRIGLEWMDVRQVSESTLGGLEIGLPLAPDLPNGLLLQVPGDTRIFAVTNGKLSEIIGNDTLEGLVLLGASSDAQDRLIFEICRDVSDDTVKLTPIGTRLDAESFSHTTPDGANGDISVIAHSILRTASNQGTITTGELSRALRVVNREAFDLLVTRMAIHKLIAWTEWDQSEKNLATPSEVTILPEGLRRLSELDTREQTVPPGQEVR